MSKNPNKWDGILAAVLKDKNNDFAGLLDVLFSYLDRKTAFFDAWGTSELSRIQRRHHLEQDQRILRQAPPRQTRVRSNRL